MVYAFTFGVSAVGVAIYSLVMWIDGRYFAEQDRKPQIPAPRSATRPTVHKRVSK